jgi:FKBP-type peptidyl-prolyl cis-trans isomerase FklB
MKRIIIVALTLVVSASFFTANAGKKDKKKQQQPKAPVVLTTHADSLSYLSGMAMCEGLTPFLKNNFGVEEQEMPVFLKSFENAMTNISDDSLKAVLAGLQVADIVKNRMFKGVQEEFEGEMLKELFYRGFRDGLYNDSILSTPQKASPLFKQWQQEKAAQKAEATRKAGEQFLEENKTKPGVMTTPSGLQYRILEEGDGPSPSKEDKVVVKYEGKLIDGTVFDSSYKRQPPTTSFGVTQVIPGWTEALLAMKKGSKWELFIPQQLAYGARQAGEIPPFSTLIFTVELVDIQVAEPAKAEEPKTEAAPAAGKKPVPVKKAPTAVKKKTR